MTEQELNKKVNRIERKTNSFCTKCGAYIGELLTDSALTCAVGMMLLLPVMMIVRPIFSVLIILCVLFYLCMDYATRKENAGNLTSFWKNFISSYSGSVGELSEAAQKFSDRINRLYNLKETRYLLPYQLGARLMDTYNKQDANLAQINARLREINQYYRPLKQRLEELRELQETNEVGERSLQEMDAERQELLSFKERIEASSRNLEAILDTVEIEAKKRVLQMEVTQLANAASRASANDPVEGVVSDNAYTLEQQITSEITHYLQMEREIEQRLG